MAHPEIVPGLKVRYNDTAYRPLRGEVRVVTRVDDTGVEGVGVGPESYERTLVAAGNFRERFWKLFELVEDEPTKGDTQSDDGAAGVWAVWNSEPGTIRVRHVFEEELFALRAALTLSATQRLAFHVTFVSFGSDIEDVIRATR